MVEGRGPWWKSRQQSPLNPSITSLPTRDGIYASTLVSWQGLLRSAKPFDEHVLEYQSAERTLRITHPYQRAMAGHSALLPIGK